VASAADWRHLLIAFWPIILNQRVGLRPLTPVFGNATAQQTTTCFPTVPDGIRLLSSRFAQVGGILRILPMTADLSHLHD
jgi:hypothetical protein